MLAQLACAPQRPSRFVGIRNTLDNTVSYLIKWTIVAFALIASGQRFITLQSVEIGLLHSAILASHAQQPHACVASSTIAKQGHVETCRTISWAG